MRQLTVLMSGFDPYEGVEINPSLIVPRALAEQGIGDGLDGVDVTVHAVTLEVSFTNAWPTLSNAIDRIHPNIVIATGLKRAARGILLERCAENKRDTHRPDAHNVVPSESRIDPNGPAAYWTGLPLRAILNAFTKDNIPATLSSDAGTFVCNALFYRLQEWASTQDHVLSGFVNLPLVNEQPHPQHGIPLDAQITAGQDVVRATAQYYVRNYDGGELLF